KESVESVGYEECCEENVEGLRIETKESFDNNEYMKKFDKLVNGNDMNKRKITRGNKIAYHKIGTGNIGLKSSGKSCKEDDKNKCLEVTGNLVNEKDETEGGNKRMGLSSLICSSENVDGANGRERNEINVSSLLNECDVVMNSSKGDWTSNFNKPVDIIKECSVEQKEDVGLEIQTVVAIIETLSCSLPIVVGANEHIICPNEGGIQKGVCLFGRCCDLKNVNGLIAKEKGCNKVANRFDVCNTNPESSIKSMWNRLFNDQKLASGFNANKIATTDVGMNLEKEVASDVTTVDVLNSESSELTKEGSESVDHGKGLVVNMAAEAIFCWKIKIQKRWCDDLEKETKSFINAVSQARIRLRVLSRNKVTCGLELDTQFGVLKRKLSHLDVKSVIGHLENEGLGYVKFDMWIWPTRKKINGTQCRIKPMKWKFDMWRWTKRKKERRKESYVKLMFWYEDLYKEFGLECCRKGEVVLLFMFDAVVDRSSKIWRGNEVKTKFAREGIKGKIAYKLEMLEKAKIHLVFYASQLKKDKRMQKEGDKVVYVLVLAKWASGNVGATWKCIEDVMKSFIRSSLDA
nr:hypothetical protein [Tanacetum cinerariifolium]